jgi:hypothetical protein
MQHPEHVIGIGEGDQEVFWIEPSDGVDAVAGDVEA